MGGYLLSASLLLKMSLLAVFCLASLSLNVSVVEDGGQSPVML